MVLADGSPISVVYLGRHGIYVTLKNSLQECGPLGLAMVVTCLLQELEDAPTSVPSAQAPGCGPPDT